MKYLVLLCGWKYGKDSTADLSPAPPLLLTQAQAKQENPCQNTCCPHKIQLCVCGTGDAEERKCTAALGMVVVGKYYGLNPASK